MWYSGDDERNSPGYVRYARDGEQIRPQKKEKKKTRGQFSKRKEEKVGLWGRRRKGCCTLGIYNSWKILVSIPV